MLGTPLLVAHRSAAVAVPVTVLDRARRPRATPRAPR